MHGAKSACRPSLHSPPFIPIKPHPLFLTLECELLVGGGGDLARTNAAAAAAAAAALLRCCSGACGGVRGDKLVQRRVADAAVEVRVQLDLRQRATKRQQLR